MARLRASFGSSQVAPPSSPEDAHDLVPVRRARAGVLERGDELVGLVLGLLGLDRAELKAKTAPGR